MSTKKHKAKTLNENALINLNYPVTAKEALDNLEKGGILSVPELGGLGPSYELAIWFGIMRMIKHYHDEDVTQWVDEKTKQFKKNAKTKSFDIVDDKLTAICKDLQLSMMQAGVIKRSSYYIIKDGWRKVLTQQGKTDKHIQLSKWVPKYEEE